ncbi:MAG: FKBP-type peptidyl-prolyl cis-trans isomerase [Candidatus Saccharibacteria bacterium]|nr:FKBP-type peptidyl-prolyl cis-trans isomerase [Candidatus Saccharibacteria bacterium]
MKNKQVIIAGTVAGVLVLSGVGFGVWQHSHGKKSEPSLSLLSGDDYTLPASESASSSVPLTETKPTTNPNNSLNVSVDSAANKLGQITPTQNKAGGSSGGANASGSSTPSALDPSTFAQYEKYKEGQSGLFGDIQVGNGAELTAGKKAAVYYKGWLTNGQLFDQSRAGSDGKIQPFVFTLGEHQVIVGWEQALSGMKVGGTRLVIVPPAVGYGASGQGSIPGNSVLVFQVELAAVQ